MLVVKIGLLDEPFGLDRFILISKKLLTNGKFQDSAKDSAMEIALTQFQTLSDLAENLTRILVHPVAPDSG